MSLITLDEAKRQCRIELDDSEEDVYLQALIDAAISHIESDTHKTLIPVDQEIVVTLDPDTLEPVPPFEQPITAAIRLAGLLLIGHWYANREAVAIGTISTTVPLAYDTLVRPYRELIVG